MQLAWLAIASLVIGLYLLSISPRLLELTRLHRDERAFLVINVGFPVEYYSLYIFALELIAVLAFVVTAAVLYWRKPDDRIVFLVSTSLMTFIATINPAYDALGRMSPEWSQVILLMHVLGVGLTLLVLFVFPDGHFVPGWTRILTYIGVGWLGLWLLFSSSFDYETLGRFVQPVLYTVSSSPMEAERFLETLRVSALYLVMLIWFGTGLFAQTHRYRCVSTEAQRQQTRWVLFSIAFSFVGYFGFNLPLRVIPELIAPGGSRVLYFLFGEPIYLLTLLMVPVFLTVSIYRHRLWDIDFLINRTLVYGAVTGLLGLSYVGGILLLQRISLLLTGGESDQVVIAITTLVIAFLFMPLRQRIQTFVDRRFYREQVDFRQAFTEFSQHVRTLIEMPELLHVLVQRTIHLYHIKYGAVYLFCEVPNENNEKGEHSSQGVPLACQLADAHDLPDAADLELKLDAVSLTQLQMGNTVSRPRHSLFPLLIPLLSPKTDLSNAGASALLGVLALGPRLSGLAYFREDITLLRGLADQAGTSIYVARLIEEKQAEARRLAAAERQIEAHRNSPLGRAEALAEQILAEPENRLLALYRLTQSASGDVQVAALLHNLPQVFFNQDRSDYGRLAQGFEYIYSSRRQPEMLPLGLRLLIAELVESLSKGESSPDASPVLALIGLCLKALESETIPSMIEWGNSLTEQTQAARLSHFQAVVDLLAALDDLGEVVASLRSSDRLETPEDKLTYLAAAVERLGRLERKARTRYGGADRPIVQGIIEKWLAVITRAMSDLQSRAHLTCELLTRHTWQGAEIIVALSLRNDGRSAALNVRISLSPSADYSLIEETAHVERLSPGDETSVSLRVRPRLENITSQFRARFVILYSDPRGLDQVENFADVVHLMQTTTEFRFIPNPYVVGTPLQAGSPLFCGRQDVVDFIQQNLDAAHRNNLVLIGQRRTGKTSLLKQLPSRLGDEYVSIYLDGQALGLDPGLPNFFLTLATEMAFALEDRGFTIDMPALEDFSESPALSFERSFLARLRQAIGGRHILLMLDEFEELESSVRRGDLDASIFGFLRHIIQHYEDLSVIFCGTHRLEELASDYWSVLFNISLYHHISLLERNEALRLVQEPVAAFGMRYDDLALDKIWRVTAGHPYFLQLLCHSLVNRHNKTQRPYATVVDVNAALEEILASGEAHFVYLWTGSSAEERLTLTALSRMAPLSGRVTPLQVVEYLQERGVSLERQVVSDCLHRLSLRDILTSAHAADQTSEEYSWKLGLLGFWVERYKSLNRVVDEVKK